MGGVVWTCLRVRHGPRIARLHLLVVARRRLLLGRRRAAVRRRSARAVEAVAGGGSCVGDKQLVARLHTPTPIHASSRNAPKRTETHQNAPSLWVSSEGSARTARGVSVIMSRSDAQTETRQNASRGDRLSLSAILRRSSIERDRPTLSMGAKSEEGSISSDGGTDLSSPTSSARVTRATSRRV